MRTRSGWRCVALLAVTSSLAIAAEHEAAPAALGPITGGFTAVAEPNESGVRFAQGEAVAAHAREMQTKLRDPDERAALRYEQRAAIVRMHPDVGRVLGIDAALEERLIDMLTDQTMVRLDEMFASERTTQLDDRMQDRAAAHTRDMDQQQALLGEDGWRRFEAYRTSVPERSLVAHFEQSLPEEYRLTDDVRERVVDILRSEREAQTVHARPGFGTVLGAPGQPPDRNQLERLTARANHQSLREMEASSARTLATLRSVLTPRQFEAYAAMETAKLASQRKFVEQQIAQAGLTDAELNAEEPAPIDRKPVAGRLSFDLSVHVNGVESMYGNVIVDNGVAAEVAIADGLTMEATPTLSDDGWLDLKLRFFEGTGEGRHALPGQSGSGHLMRDPNGATRDTAIASTVVQGRKGYAVMLRMTKVRLRT